MESYTNQNAFQLAKDNLYYLRKGYRSDKYWTTKCIMLQSILLIEN